MENALVSIIIPVYNVEKYLEEAMESVIRQTLPEIEIICINDGSTDSSPDILKSYAERDARIRLIDKKNEGYGIGMNLGIDLARGKYIGILEPDDFVPEDMFRTLAETAETHMLDFVKADFYRFTGDDPQHYSKTLFKLSQFPADYKRIFDPSHDPSSLTFVMNTWSGIYRREFLNSFNIRHNTTPGASFQDTGFWWQTFIHAKRAMLLDTPFYMNRRDNPNSSVYDTKKICTMFTEYDFIHEKLREDPEIWERFKYMYWRCRFMGCRDRLRRVAPEFHTDYIDRMHREISGAMDAGDADLSVFAPSDRRLAKVLIRHPGMFISAMKLEDHLLEFKQTARGIIGKR